MTDHKAIRYFSPRLIFFERDEYGKTNVIHIGDCGGFILSEEETNAIIEFCLKDKEIYRNDKERDFKNWRHQQEIDEERMRNQVIQEERKKANKVSGLNGKFKCTIYLMKDTIRGFIKIGMTSGLSGRFSQLKTANPAIEILKSYIGTRDDEVILHKHFMQHGKRVDGEWFSLGNADIEYVDNYFNKNAHEQ